MKYKIIYNISALALSAGGFYLTAISGIISNPLSKLLGFIAIISLTAILVLKAFKYDKPKLFNRFIRTKSDDFIIEPSTIRIRYAIKDDAHRIAEIAEFYLGEGNGFTKQKLKQLIVNKPFIFRVLEITPSPKSNKKKWHTYGYYSIVPLLSSTYDLLKQGKIQDYDINEESIIDFKSDQLNAIFIMDLMSCKMCHVHSKGHKWLSGLLLKDIFKNINHIIEGNSNIKEVSTIVASSEGRKLVKKAGFSKLSKYRNPLGWEFWISSTSALNIEKLKRQLYIFNKTMKFEDDYTI